MPMPNYGMRALTGIKEQAAKSIKDSTGGFTTGSHRARRFSGGFDASSSSSSSQGHLAPGAAAAGAEAKLKRAEESLRTVMYLSCWGPN